MIYDNRMLYEPLVETAPSFKELRERLLKRGYSQLPFGAAPMLRLDGYKKAPLADTSSFKVRSVMIQKKT